MLNLPVGLSHAEVGPCDAFGELHDGEPARGRRLAPGGAERDELIHGGGQAFAAAQREGAGGRLLDSCELGGAEGCKGLFCRSALWVLAGAE